MENFRSIQAKNHLPPSSSSPLLFGLEDLGDGDENERTPKKQRTITPLDHRNHSIIGNSMIAAPSAPPFRYYNGDIESFPPGYRFQPTDTELIDHYLKKKVNNELLPPSRIHDVMLYEFNPEDLSLNYTACDGKEWYFFTPRDKKYKNGQRPNRAAGNGYWKATGADKGIFSNSVRVGSKKALVFYMGKPPKGIKTSWIMHEYKLVEADTPIIQRGPNDMRLDEWVLCKIHKKQTKAEAENAEENEEADDVAEEVDSAAGAAAGLDDHHQLHPDQLNGGGASTMALATGLYDHPTYDFGGYSDYSDLINSNMYMLDPTDPFRNPIDQYWAADDAGQSHHPHPPNH